MNYEYKIVKEAYDAIKRKDKTIEFRLLNEKSLKINTGDYIKFNVIDGSEYVDTKVVNKYIYNDVEELWNSKEVENNILGYSKEELYQALYDIYGKEKVDKSKIVGFKIELI